MKVGCPLLDRKLLLLGYPIPLIRSERRCRKPGLVKKIIRSCIVHPAVSHCYRVCDLFSRNDHMIALDGCNGRNKLPCETRDLESFQWLAANDQTAFEI